MFATTIMKFIGGKSKLILDICQSRYPSLGLMICTTINGGFRQNVGIR